MVCLKTRKDGTVLLSLHIQPKASHSRMVGMHDDRLKVAIASPPVDGKANKALLKFLAHILGVPPRDLAVVSGLHSRQKQVAIVGLAEQEVRAAIEQFLCQL